MQLAAAPESEAWKGKSREGAERTPRSQMEGRGSRSLDTCSMAGLCSSAQTPAAGAGCPGCEEHCLRSQPFPFCSSPSTEERGLGFLILCKAASRVLVLAGSQSHDVVCKQVLEVRQLQRLRWNPWLLEGTSGCTRGSCSPPYSELCNPSNFSLPNQLSTCTGSRFFLM